MKPTNLRREPVIITKRRRLTKAEIKDLDKRDGHQCVSCGSTKALQEEHLIPRSIKPDDTIKNVRWMCESCHKPKTTQDRKIIAKTKRVSAKHAGEWRKTKRPLKTRGFVKRVKQKWQSKPFQKRPKK